MNELAGALSILNMLLQAGSNAYIRASRVSAIIAKRMSEGREKWTDEELKEIEDAFDEAKYLAHKAVDEAQD